MTISLERDCVDAFPELFSTLQGHAVERLGQVGEGRSVRGRGLMSPGEGGHLPQPFPEALAKGRQKDLSSHPQSPQDSLPPQGLQLRYGELLSTF